MAKANPPPHRPIPQSIRQNPEMLKFFEDFIFDMFLLWKKLGGGEDFIEMLIQELSRIRTNVNANTALIGSIDVRNLEIIKTSADYTTEPFQIVICDNEDKINITLDTNAQEDDIVHIKRKNAEVNVIGQIDGKTNKRINVKYYSMHLVFDGTEWTEI